MTNDVMTFMEVSFKAQHCLQLAMHDRVRKVIFLAYYIFSTASGQFSALVICKFDFCLYLSFDVGTTRLVDRHETPAVRCRRRLLALQ